MTGTTITVRDINADDVQSLIEGATIEAVQHDSFGRFIPVTLTLNGSRRAVVDVHPPQRDEDGNVKRSNHGLTTIDQSVTLGRAVTVNTVTAYRTESSATLFDTFDAEEAYYAVNGASRRRHAPYLAIPDEAGDQKVTMMPVYGSQVTLTVFVKDVDPAAALASAEAAVVAGFPDGAARVASARSRAVADRRVTVAVEATTGPLDTPAKVVARNVLDAEAGYVLTSLGYSQHGCLTTAEDPADEMFVGS